jgi:NAD+ diphosphatase
MTKQFYWFVFKNNKLLLQKRNGKYAIPFCIKEPLSARGATLHAVGMYKQYPCKTFELKATVLLLKKFEFIDLRSAYDLIAEELFCLAAKASQIIYWDNNSQYCPRCGSKTNTLNHTAKICPACKKEIYPVISTAVMVLVRRGDAALMVRGNNFKGSHYGLVAGFLETGETLEECARREVFEETNIKIKNLKYFASASWSFPSGIMIGFTADYASGRLKIDKKELSAAGFFTKNDMPPLPGEISLARKMIDAWAKQL